MRPTNWSLGLATLWMTGARAAPDIAVCLSQYQWMSNSKGQSPCIVYAHLSGVCTLDGVWPVASLSGTGVATYSPPSGSIVSPCQCSTVTYTLLQACSSCQGLSIGDVVAWMSQCPEAYVANAFPYQIPPSTAVPAWADIDPRGTGNTWNMTRAQLLAATPAPATSLTSSASQSTHQSATEIPIASSGNSTLAAEPVVSHRPTIGVLVGSIVAAFVGGVLLSWIFFSCVHRPPPPRNRDQIWEIDARLNPPEPAPRTVAPRKAAPLPLGYHLIATHAKGGARYAPWPEEPAPRETDRFI